MNVKENRKERASYGSLDPYGKGQVTLIASLGKY
jgi:hypothetical protein